jgi:hypothetical protein
MLEAWLSIDPAFRQTAPERSVAWNWWTGLHYESRLELVKLSLELPAETGEEMPGDDLQHLVDLNSDHDHGRNFGRLPPRLYSAAETYRARIGG